MKVKIVVHIMQLLDGHSSCNSVSILTSFDDAIL